MTEQRPVPEGYWQNAHGDLIPERNVRPQDKLEDELVREVMAEALDIQERLMTLKARVLAKGVSFKDLIAQEYQVRKGGKKGNMKLSSYDGTMQVQFAVSDQIAFGVELTAAKALVDQCVQRWSEGANDNIRALVDHAFQVNKGRIDTHRVLGLTRLEIDDDEWQRAMQAIKDAVRVTSTKTYVRFFVRTSDAEDLTPVVLNMANA